MSLKNLRRLLLGFSLLAILSSGGFLTWESHQMYERELSVLQRNIESQATLLAEHAQLTLSAASRVLMEITWQDDRPDMQASLASHMLYRTILSTPQFAALIVSDAKGQPLFTAKRFAMTTGNLADQYFFKLHREGAHYSIGRPFTAGEDEKALVPVSNRLIGADGSFMGVASVLLDTTYFQNFYTSVSDDQHLRIGMFRRDGTALTLYPAPLAELPSSRAGLEALFASHEADTLIHTSPLDGTKRISAYRNLTLSPVAVTVSYDYSTFIAGLYPGFLRNGLIFLMLTIGIVISAVVIDRVMRNVYRAREAQLDYWRQQQATLQLCHTIARNLPNGRIFVLDHELRYVFVDGQSQHHDPSLQPQAMIGKTIREIYPLESRQAIETLARSALSGDETDQEIPYAGRVYKAFAAPLPDEDGSIQRCLLLSQDITQFKANQQYLEALNLKLHRLAKCDGLLGIANRGEFDRVLEREWRRAIREGKPIGLLMIDVDYFKRYNDAYGHLEGDACLQKVAAVLNEVVRRPSDLAARYGGEEMVVLLPGVDTEGALHVARRIHTLLAQQAIPFSNSPVADYVTVSIGVISRLAGPDHTALSLIEHADAALYAAKAKGRNSIEVYDAQRVASLES